MSDEANFRVQRIEKLLYELRYEIERGLVGNEISETMGFEFVFPISREIEGGAVHFEMRMRPVLQSMVNPRLGTVPRIRVIKSSSD